MRLAVLVLALLFSAPDSEDTLTLVETTPVETTLGSDDVPEAADVWLDMIRGAKTRIHLGQFYVSDEAPSRLTPVLAALVDAAGRGVKVRLLAEKKFQRTYPEELARLDAVDGIELRLYDISQQTGGILHAKYFTVDGKSSYLGSQNFDWRALEHIQELGVRVDSEAITAQIDRMFRMDWGEDETWPVGAEAKAAGAVRCGELEVLPVFSPKSLCPEEAQWDLPHLIDAIDSAKSRVRIQLLNYKAANRDKTYFGDLEVALRSAAARKVEVELLFADWSKSRGTIEGLQSLQVLPHVNVKLVTLPEYSKGFIPFARVIHCKYMVVDGRTSWIGTSNWSGDYFHASRNVGLMVEGESFGAQLDRFFQQGWDSEYATLVDPCGKYEAPRRQ